METALKLRSNAEFRARKPSLNIMARLDAICDANPDRPWSSEDFKTVYIAPPAEASEQEREELLLMGILAHALDTYYLTQGPVLAVSGRAVEILRTLQHRFHAATDPEGLLLERQLSPVSGDSHNGKIHEEAPKQYSLQDGMYKGSNGRVVFNRRNGFSKKELALRGNAVDLL